MAAGRTSNLLERLGFVGADGAPLLGVRERSLLVAAGAASGLAAVYQVPIGGVVPRGGDGCWFEPAVAVCGW